MKTTLRSIFVGILLACTSLVSAQHGQPFIGDGVFDVAGEHDIAHAQQNRRH